MLGRSESSELAAARLHPGNEATFVPNGCRSSAKVLAGMFALARTLTGIDTQPITAVAKDLIKPPISELPQGMRPETGRNTCFTATG
jgi:hypothetical protein